MGRDQLAEHLKFAAELGVAGLSRDPVWRERMETVTIAHTEQAVTPGGDGQGEGERPGDLNVEPQAPAVFARSAADALAALRAEIGPQCTRCKLHALGRRQVVFGEGNPSADLMFVGE